MVFFRSLSFFLSRSLLFSPILFHWQSATNGRRNNCNAIFIPRKLIHTHCLRFVCFFVNAQGFGRTAAEQGGYQLMGIATTVLFAILAGILTGLCLNSPAMRNLKKDELHDDEVFWEIGETSFDKNNWLCATLASRMSILFLYFSYNQTTYRVHQFNYICV